MKPVYTWIVVVMLMATSFRAGAQDASNGEAAIADTLVEDEEDVAAELDTAVMYIRSVPDSTVERLQKEKDFLYANDPAYWTRKQESKVNKGLPFFIKLLQNPAVTIIAYSLLALLAAYVLYQVMVVNNLFIFSRTSKKKSVAQEGNEEAVTDDIDEKISRAIAGHDLRQAVRYLYLKTLKTLHDKSLIRFHSQATNNDYLQQMRQSPRFKEFNLLTQVYEYVWYGEFEPNSLQFETIHQNFNHFIKG